MTNDSASDSLSKKLSTRKFSRKLNSWSLLKYNIWRISCTIDIEAWLILYALVGLRLECYKALCVFIKYTSFLWRDIEHHYGFILTYTF